MSTSTPLLDAFKTEKSIQRELNQIAKGKTTLIVAHRLSTIVNADNIIVLKDGKIQEQGNHSQLLDFGGVYAQMWATQHRQTESESLDVLQI